MTIDLKKLLTKGEFAVAMKKRDDQFVAIDKRFRQVDVRFYGIEQRLGRIEENMYTKGDHRKYMEWLDNAMNELRDARTERKLSESQILRLDDKVADHEKRIRSLEKTA